jgi:hypothetical protein|tara:strand:+ start:248 stop:388 length:141 start_codon:yes stop_codon:yes gene_type:complete
MSISQLELFPIQEGANNQTEYDEGTHEELSQSPSSDFKETTMETEN